MGEALLAATIRRIVRARCLGRLVWPVQRAQPEIGFCDRGGASRHSPARSDGADGARECERSGGLSPRGRHRAGSSEPPFGYATRCNGIRASQFIVRCSSMWLRSWPRGKVRQGLLRGRRMRQSNVRGIVQCLVRKFLTVVSSWLCFPARSRASSLIMSLTCARSGWSCR